MENTWRKYHPRSSNLVPPPLWVLRPYEKFQPVSGPVMVPCKKSTVGVHQGDTRRLRSGLRTEGGRGVGRTGGRWWESGRQYGSVRKTSRGNTGTVCFETPGPPGPTPRKGSSRFISVCVRWDGGRETLEGDVLLGNRAPRETRRHRGPVLCRVCPTVSRPLSQSRLEGGDPTVRDGDSYFHSTPSASVCPYRS